MKSLATPWRTPAVSERIEENGVVTHLSICARRGRIICRVLPRSALHSKDGDARASGASGQVVDQFDLRYSFCLSRVTTNYRNL